ncbi:MAG: hypothetical protein HQL11_03560 [Candidatus Omnitrophica bacterium]|nr:hypothetical protein [Candidatus Omnitrophota bacterium]
MSEGLLKEIRQIEETPRKLREFGLVVGSVLILFGGVLWRIKGVPFLPFAYSGAALVALGFIRPVWLKLPNKVWMSLALAMGWVMGRVLLSVLFFGVLTPIALFLKSRKKQFLDTRMAPDAETYWVEVDAKRDARALCEKQY